jgi:hypothetical protein
VNNKFRKWTALYVSVVTECVCAFNSKTNVFIILWDSPKVQSTASCDLVE